MTGLVNFKVCQLYALLNIFRIRIGVSLKGKISLPMRSIFLPLTVAHFKTWLPRRETYTRVWMGYNDLRIMALFIINSE